jgi:hypothetical protein
MSGRFEPFVLDALRLPREADIDLVDLEERLERLAANFPREARLQQMAELGRVPDDGIYLGRA